MKKVCVVTVSRADYGLLKWVIKEIEESSDLELQLIVSGTHPSAAHGHTVREISNDGFPIAATVPIVPRQTTPRDITAVLGEGLTRFGDVLTELEPDIMVVLGDRSETVIAAVAATVAGIPIAHIHGGEITEGAIDDAFRHAITKMSHLHFVAEDEHRQRVIHMGEDPDNVTVVGPMGHEAISRIEMMSRDGLEKHLGVTFGDQNLLVTLHPETLQPDNNPALLESVLRALQELPGAHLFLTGANADSGGDEFNDALASFAKTRPNTWFFDSLGQSLYLSLLGQVDAVVGNSSSGIHEAPVFGIATVDIGERQKGRSSRPSILHTAASDEHILENIERAMVFRRENSAIGTIQPGRDFPSSVIVRTLRQRDLESLRLKPFIDIATVTNY